MNTNATYEQSFADGTAALTHWLSVPGNILSQDQAETLATVMNGLNLSEMVGLIQATKVNNRNHMLVHPLVELTLVRLCYDAQAASGKLPAFFRRP